MSGRHSYLSRRETYRFGAIKDGWCCLRCDHRSAFDHNGRPRRTYLRFWWHGVVRHHRILSAKSPGTAHAHPGVVYNRDGSRTYFAIKSQSLSLWSEGIAS